MARQREGEKGREGRIKTNPLCELVLVAMATIITSHLGEQEQEEEEEEEGREKERKKERRDGKVGDEDVKAGARTQLGEKRENEMSDPRNCAEMSRRGGGQKCDSSMPGGQLFELRTLLSLKQEKITPQLEPNLQKMSALVSHLRERAGLMKKTN